MNKSLVPGQLAALRYKLVTYFSIGEIKDLCFDLGVEYENLADETLSGKSRELVAFMYRRGRIGELIDSCSKASTTTRL